MAYKIVFTKNANKSIADVIDYLELKWSYKVSTNFITILNQHILLLASGVVNGNSSNTKDVKSILVTKHNRLYYRIKDNTLQLLLLWDTRQNPTRHPFE